jgi:hypothetical protein
VAGVLPELPVKPLKQAQELRVPAPAEIVSQILEMFQGLGQTGDYRKRAYLHEESLSKTL